MLSIRDRCCGRRTEVPSANGGGDRKSFPNVGSSAVIVRQPRRSHTPAALQDSSQAVPRVWKKHLSEKSTQKRLKRGLKRVQRRATRMVEAVRHLEYPERLRKLGMPTLYYRRRRGDMITVYQLLHGGMAVDPETFLKQNCSEQTRGHPWKLRKPRAS